jgi:hypothetical protein
MESGDSSPFQEARPVAPTKALTGQRTPIKTAAASRTACNFHFFPVSSLPSIMRRYNCARGGLMRAFVKLRRMLASNDELPRRFDELESKDDRKFGVVFEAIRQLMSPPLPRRKQIRFRSRSVKK